MTFRQHAIGNGSADGDMRLLVLVGQVDILIDATLLASYGFPRLDRTAEKNGPVLGAVPAITSRFECISR